MSVDVVSERIDIIEELSIVIGISKDVVLLVGEAYQELLENAKRRGLKSKPGLGDAIVLATARMLNAKVVTGDEHFKGLDVTAWISE